MKYILILTITFTTLLAKEDLLAYIDDIQKINDTLQKVIQESQPNTVANIKALYDPFYKKKEKKVSQKAETKAIKSTKKSKPIKNDIAISMILNQNTLINGRWYKVNDKLDDYVINKINQDTVVLKRNQKYTTLKLQKTNSILIVTQEIK